MNGLQILGTGRALPEHVVTNDDLAKIVDTSDEWIVSRTGIKERRFAREGENLTQFAVEAARLEWDQMPRKTCCARLPARARGLLRRCAAQKSSLCSPNTLPCKAFGAFDPTRGGLPPPRAPPP